MHDTRTFALALDRIEGVGRVTAGRLIARFATYDDLRRYPREQVLARIKGVPGAAAIVGRLFDDDAMQAHLTEAAAALDALRGRGVTLLTPRDDAWPAGLNDLPPARRPHVLYAYGPLDALHAPLVALFARPPLDEGAYDRAQALVRHLVGAALAPVTAAATGFDVVVHKLAAAGRARGPSVLVAACGMARLQPPMRPTVSAAVNAGGVLVSPWPMEHGPFEHDDADRALVQAALADAAVFVDPAPETPEWHAMAWALDAERPVFAVPGAGADLPDRVHPVASEVDFEWVVAAGRRDTSASGT